MTYKQAIKTLAAVAGLALGAAQTNATEITQLDYTGPQTPEILNNITGVWGPSWGWNGGPRGTALEDNETEANSARVFTTSGSFVGTALGTDKGQMWDLEGMAINEHSGHLYMVGGYDFNAGIAHQGLPGDLFIKLGSAGTFQPVVDPLGGSYLNGTGLLGTPGYDFAIKLSGGGMTGVPFSVTVVDLNAASSLDSVRNDALGSNPWKLSTGALNDGTFTASAVYKTGLSAAATALYTGEAGFATLHGDTDAGNTGGYTAGTIIQNTHNVLDIDVSFLRSILPANKVVTFSYTMQCGNDQMKGRYGGGFQLVPDGGASLILLGGGLSTLCLFGRRFRK